MRRKPKTEPSMIIRKSRRELGLMRKAGLLVWQAHQRVAELVQPGVTTAEIDAAVAELFRRHQATPLFLNYPGEVPFPAVTCISVNEEVVHGIPGPRRLREGDIVGVDTGCRLRGWCGDAAATYRVGTVSHEAQRLLDVTRGALNLAIELLGGKQHWSEVAREMERFVRGAGFAVVTDFLGHGIGREMHEEPQVPNYWTDDLRDVDFRLVEGLVLAIEPMVNAGTEAVELLDDHWTVVTADRRLSAHFEHTVAITADGPWVLTGPPQPGEEL